MALVLDTDVTKSFIETLETLEPSKEQHILRMVLELIKTVKAYENRLHEKNLEIECLMKSLDELEDKAREMEGSDSVYGDEEEEEDGKA